MHFKVGQNCVQMEALLFTICQTQYWLFTSSEFQIRTLKNLSNLSQFVGLLQILNDISLENI